MAETRLRYLGQKKPHFYLHRNGSTGWVCALDGELWIHQGADSPQTLWEWMGTPQKRQAILKHKRWVNGR